MQGCVTIAGSGERECCDALNNFYMRNKIKAFAFRLKQSRGVKQWCDLLSDTKVAKYFFAIEVKAVRGKRALNFNSDFQMDDDSNEHQIERQLTLADRTGRKPYIVVYVRNGVGRKNEFYVFDSRECWKMFNDGKVSILAKEYDTYNKKNELWKILNKQV